MDLELDSGWMFPDWTGEINYAAYGGADYREYNGQVGPLTIAEYSWSYVDGATVEDMVQHDGNVINWYSGEEHWAGHAFGKDFLEYGVSLDAVRAYWGEEYLQPGDMIGIAAFIETPIDDWGVDVTPSGHLRVPEMQLSKEFAGKAGTDGASIPTEFALNDNYPNPFNPETEIRFQLPENSHVIIRVYNSLGQEINTLTDTYYEAGYHNVRWSGTDGNGFQVSSGVYVYSIQAGTFQQMKKMILIK